MAPLYQNQARSDRKTTSLHRVRYGSSVPEGQIPVPKGPFSVRGSGESVRPCTETRSRDCKDCGRHTGHHVRGLTPKDDFNYLQEQGNNYGKKDQNPVVRQHCEPYVGV